MTGGSVSLAAKKQTAQCLRRSRRVALIAVGTALLGGATCVLGGRSLRFVSRHRHDAGVCPGSTTFSHAAWNTISAMRRMRFKELPFLIRRVTECNRKLLPR